MKPISDEDIIKEVNSVEHGRVTIVKKDCFRDRVVVEKIKKPQDFKE